MTERVGLYGDERTYALPDAWDPLALDVLDLALQRAIAALAMVTDDPTSAEHRLGAYYAPEGGYAGNLFSSVEPNEAFGIGAADLWAVSTLSMKVPPLTGRRLLNGAKANEVVRHLHRLSPTRTISELDATTLLTMWDLQDCLRTVMSESDTKSNWWVFGAKMCSRKRPLLFPVRDQQVCSYLSGGKPLGRGPGKLGNFTRDMQVFAYLMTHELISSGLAQLRARLSDSEVAAQVDWSDLRLLDIALWTAAVLGTPSRSSA